QVAGRDALVADHVAVVEHREVERPVLWGPGRQCTPGALDDPEGHVPWWLLGPRGHEGLVFGVVDAGDRQVRQCAECVRCGQAQVEARGRQGEAQRREMIYQHTSSCRSRMSAVIFFSWIEED